jgi:uncharacterized protein (DUF1778 family)
MMLAEDRLEIRVSKKKKSRYQKLAAADGRTLSNWVLRVLDLADPDSKQRPGDKTDH